MDTPESALTRLYATLIERKGADAQTSYVASLYTRPDTILKKIAEEAAETVIAAKNGDRAGLVHELADLWFHTLVLMAERGIGPADVTGELNRRMGQSGLAEKASRHGK